MDNGLLLILILWRVLSKNKARATLAPLRKKTVIVWTRTVPVCPLQHRVTMGLFQSTITVDKHCCHIGSSMKFFYFITVVTVWSPDHDSEIMSLRRLSAIYFMLLMPWSHCIILGCLPACDQWLQTDCCSLHKNGWKWPGTSDELTGNYLMITLWSHLSETDCICLNDPATFWTCDCGHTAVTLNNSLQKTWLASGSWRMSVFLNVADYQSTSSHVKPCSNCVDSSCNF